MRRFKKLFVTILVVATILGTASAFTSAAGLLDVEGTKYADSVNKLVGLNVLTGFPDGTFKPGATVTRAQMAAILVRALGFEDAAKAAKGATPFADVPATHWASGYVNVAFNKGIVTGVSETKFNPDDNVTYAQAATMLVRATGHAGEVTGAWPAGYIEVATKYGLIENTTFAASSPATRGDIAIMTETAVYDVKDANGATLAWTVFKAPEAQPDKAAPVVALGTLDATTAADKVTVTGTVTDASAVTVKVNGTAVTVTAGAFSADVALTVGANTIKVDAADAYGNASTASASVARIGAAATLTISPATAEVTVGGTQAFTVTAKDSAGQTVTVTPTYAATGVGTVAADGTLTASDTPGTGTVVATAGDLTATANVTVKVGAVDHIAVTPATANLASGSTQAFTAKAYDAKNNELSGVSFAWTATGAGVMGVDGTYAATGSGAATVTASAGGKQGTAAVTVYGTGAKIALAVSSSEIVANGVSTSTVTATVQDANGNTVSTGEYTINFASVTPALATLSAASAKTVGGVASVTATSVAAGAGTAIVSASDSAGKLTGATATFKTTAQKATSVVLSASPATMGSDLASATTITATLKDQAGANMNAPAGGVAINLTSGTTTVAAFTGGANTIAIAAGSATGTNASLAATGTPGSTSITGTVTTAALNTLPVSGVTVSTTIVGAPNKLAIDPITSVKADGVKTQKVLVRVLDANGNQVTDPGKQVTVSLTAQAGFGGAISPAGPTVNGQEQFTVTNSVAETGNYKATVTAPPAYLGAVADATADGSFTTGTGTMLAWAIGSPTPATIASDGVSKSVLSVEIHDAKGNVVPDATNAITLSRAGGTTVSLPATTTVNAVGGKASFEVTATTNVGASTFAIASTGLTAPANATVTTQIVGAANALGIYSTNSPKTVGKDLTVKVGVYDASAPVARLVTSDNGRVVTLTITGTRGTVTSSTATTVNGLATFTIQSTKSGTVTYDVASTGLTGLTAQSVTFNAGSAVSVALSADPATLAGDNASLSYITATLKDSYGNSTNAVANTNVALAANVNTYGDLNAGAGGALTVTVVAGTPSITTNVAQAFKVNTTYGTATITGTSNGLTSGTTTVTTQLVGTPNRVVVSTTGSAKADGVKTITVTADVVDFGGNRVTGWPVGLLTLTDNGTATPAIGGPATDRAGEATWTVTDTAAEDVTFTVTVGAGAPYLATNTYTATGTYTPGTATGVAIGAASGYPTTIKADGSSVTLVRARATDANNNTDTSFSGTATFSIPTGNDFGVLTSTSGTFVAGISTTYLQSKIRDIQGTVNVKVVTTLANGTSVNNNTNITVDGLRPTATVATAANGGVAAAVDAGDTVAITFSENTNTPAITAANIDTVLALSGGHTWKDVGGAIGSATWNVAGNILTVTLSAGGGAPTVAALDTITPSAAITDAVGNAVSGSIAIGGGF